MESKDASLFGVQINHRSQPLGMFLQQQRLQQLQHQSSAPSNAPVTEIESEQTKPIKPRTRQRLNRKRVPKGD